jgi:muconolactone delta-isomerase
MRYLVITEQKTPMPPEMVPGLLTALKVYNARHRAAGTIEQSWSFAGLMGGCAILNVGALEELDEVMTEFPLGPFCDIKIYGLVDFTTAIDAVQKAAGAMLAAMPKR